MTQTRIFVSHSSKDNDWARPFAAALTAIGYDVWYDEMGLQGGAAWVASIQHEVETRDVFLIVLTPEAWESKWVQDELQLAIATRRRIMPVLLRNTQVSGFLLTTQWITVIGEEPQAAARAAVLAIEAPPAPGREAAPVATTETLDELIVLCRSLASEKRYTESLAACARALALDPKNVSVLKIKAWVLHQIGEYRLEGRTCFQILLIDASGFNQSLEAVFNALDDEQEVFQAYSLVPESLKLKSLELLLRALKRLNRLESATEFMLGLTPHPYIMYSNVVLDWSRYDLALRIYEGWYGFPPKLSKVSDFPTLKDYSRTLFYAERRADSRRIEELIVHIFEATYGSAIVRPSKDSVLSYRGADKTAYDEYLKSLELIGRDQDAAAMRRIEG